MMTGRGDGLMNGWMMFAVPVSQNCECAAAGYTKGEEENKRQRSRERVAATRAQRWRWFDFTVHRRSLLHPHSHEPQDTVGNGRLAWWRP